MFVPSSYLLGHGLNFLKHLPILKFFWGQCILGQCSLNLKFLWILWEFCKMSFEYVHHQLLLVTPPRSTPQLSKPPYYGFSFPILTRHSGVGQPPDHGRLMRSRTLSSSDSSSSRINPVSRCPHSEWGSSWFSSRSHPLSQK